MENQDDISTHPKENLDPFLRIPLSDQEKATIARDAKLGLMDDSKIMKSILEREMNRGENPFGLQQLRQDAMNRAPANLARNTRNVAGVSEHWNLSMLSDRDKRAIKRMRQAGITSKRQQARVLNSMYGSHTGKRVRNDFRRQRREKRHKLMQRYDPVNFLSRIGNKFLRRENG